MHILIIYLIFVVIFINIMAMRQKELKTTIIILLIAPIYLPFVCLPIFFVNSILENNSGIIILIIVFIIVYIAIRLGINIYNKIKVTLSKEEGIYVRDMEVEYSPAVLSYLQNQKIEEKKDLVASILHLCAKGYLNIEKIGENKYTLIPVSIDNKNERLKKDEQYLYEIINKKEKIDINKWIQYVKEEFETYHYIKENNINLTYIFILLYIIAIIFIPLYGLITGDTSSQDQTIGIIVVLFSLAYELAVLEPVIRKIIKYLRKGEYLDGKYTTKGAKEMKRWDKYKKFLEDYTLLKDKPLDSVVLLEEHLAYAMVLNVNKSYTNSFIEQLEVKHKINLDFIEDLDK